MIFIGIKKEKIVLIQNNRGHQTMITAIVQFKLPEPLSSEKAKWFVIGKLIRERASFLAPDLIKLLTSPSLLFRRRDHQQASTFHSFS